MEKPWLIDANALIDDIDGDLTDGIAERKAIEKIENAPTVDAIPIDFITGYIDELEYWAKFAKDTMPENDYWYHILLKKWHYEDLIEYWKGCTEEEE